MYGTFAISLTPPATIWRVFKFLPLFSSRVDQIALITVAIYFPVLPQLLFPHRQWQVNIHITDSDLIETFNAVNSPDDSGLSLEYCHSIRPTGVVYD